MGNSQKVAETYTIVIVTHNRAGLLKDLIGRLIREKEVVLKKIIIVNNASTDETDRVIKESLEKFNIIEYIYLKVNTGGAGGFYTGTKRAIELESDWIMLMDDDVIPDDMCFKHISQFAYGKDILFPMREEQDGKFSECATIKYELSNPFCLSPRRKILNKIYSRREKCPNLVQVDCATFEGLCVRTEVLKRVGLPKKELFIQGDDTEFCLRCKKFGYKIFGVRDARMQRRLPMLEHLPVESWKTYYLWRNLFIIHFLYGENLLVRLKPFWIAIALGVMRIFLKKDYNPWRYICDAMKMSIEMKR